MGEEGEAYLWGVVVVELYYDCTLCRVLVRTYLRGGKEVNCTIVVSNATSVAMLRERRLCAGVGNGLRVLLSRVESVSMAVDLDCRSILRVACCYLQLRNECL